MAYWHFQTGANIGRDRRWGSPPHIDEDTGYWCLPGAFGGGPSSSISLGFLARLSCVTGGSPSEDRTGVGWLRRSVVGVIGDGAAFRLMGPPLPSPLLPQLLMMGGAGRGGVGWGGVVTYFVAPTSLLLSPGKCLCVCVSGNHFYSCALLLYSLHREVLRKRIYYICTKMHKLPC